MTATANDAIRNYRAILLGRLNNTKNEIEYYKKNLKYLDENPGKFKNEKLIRDLINMSIEDLTEYYNKLLAQIEIIDKDIECEASSFTFRGQYSTYTDLTSAVSAKTITPVAGDTYSIINAGGTDANGTAITALCTVAYGSGNWYIISK